MEILRVKEIVSAVNGTLLCGNEEKIITSVSTNSKEMKEQALFVPIIGERVDAHDFIESALEHGAVATFTSRIIEERRQDKVYIQVEDTMKAMQDLAAYYRSQFDIPVIGITGSVGKTTTKEMIAAALETKYSVLKTAGNMNSQVGLPLTIFNIEQKHEVAVIEMGMSEEGEMSRLAKVARPNIAVMTNIGVSHIAQLKTQENIRKEKLNFINAFQEGDCLYVNGTDPLLREIVAYKRELSKQDRTTELDVTMETECALKQANVFSFGTSETDSFYAEEITSKEGKTYFTFVYPGGKEYIELQVLGIHNVYNALSALAISLQLGIEPSVAKKGLKDYYPIAMRGQIFESNGKKIIDDSYNASPDSMKSGVHVLLAMEGVTRRIAVLADVLELGERSYELHYGVGEYIAQAKNDDNQSIDQVITIGTEAKAIVDAIKKADTTIATMAFDTNKEAIDYLKEHGAKGDAILIKGSRGMRTDEIVTELTN